MLIALKSPDLLSPAPLLALRFCSATGFFVCCSRKAGQNSPGAFRNKTQESSASQRGGPTAARTRSQAASILLNYLAPSIGFAFLQKSSFFQRMPSAGFQHLCFLASFSPRPAGISPFVRSNVSRLSLTLDKGLRQSPLLLRFSN